MDSIAEPVCFIGGGNMARAILEGCSASRAVDPSRVVIARPSATHRPFFASQGFRTASTATEAVRTLAQLEEMSGTVGQLVLAVKPQMLPEVSAELGGAASEVERVAVTMLAGVPSGVVRKKLAGACEPRVIRVMPNTPSRIRRGITAIAKGEGSKPGDAAVAERLFAAVGEIVALEEPMLDAFTGLAGSGPAYLFKVAESMVEGAKQVGFDEAEAQRIVRATLTGSALLLASTGEDPAELRRQVTSKKGTTQAGLEQLDGLESLFVAAVSAARDRGAELAKLADA